MFRAARSSRGRRPLRVPRWPVGVRDRASRRGRCGRGAHRGEEHLLRHVQPRAEVRHRRVGEGRQGGARGGARQVPGRPHLREGHFQLAGVVRSASHHVSHGAHEPEGHGCARMGAHLLGRRVRAHRQRAHRIKEESGPEAVLFYCGDPKEPRGAMQRLATLFGSPTYGTESSTCAAATWICSQLVTGQLTMGSDPTDATASCLVWSLNPAWSQPYRFGDMMKQKERGCKFVVVDPRITPTVTGLADVHLQLRPRPTARLRSGSSTSCCATVCTTRTSWRSGRTASMSCPVYVQEFTPERVEEITWVPAAKRVDGGRAHHLRARARDAGVQLGRRVPRHQRGQLASARCTRSSR